MSNYTVLAYADGQCRGAGELVDGLLFLTLYGVDGEQLTFKAMNEEGETFTIAEQLTFASDVRGTLTAPQQFTISDIKVEIPAVAHTVTPSSFYTIAGVFAGRDTRSLTPGLYIVRYADGTYRKVFIK